MVLAVVNQDHIPQERCGNKGDVANWFGVAMTTVDQWIRRGCPYLQRGERGKPWQFDLLAVAKWKYGASDVEPGEDPEKLDPKARLDWYRGTRERTKHMEECGELIEAVAFERALSEAFKTVASTLESLPDVLERDAGLDGPGVERAQMVIDRVRADLHRRLSADA